MARHGLGPSYSKADLFALDPTAKITSHVAFEFSSLLTAVHSVAASAVGQCFVEFHGDDDGLSVVSALCQTTTSINLPTAVPPSLFALANWLTIPNMHLRLVIINVLEYIIQQLSHDDCLRLLAEIRDRFTDWKIILPFACLVSKTYKLNKQFGRECVIHLFPVILEDPITMDLFASVFSQFIGFFDDRHNFFKHMIEDTTIADTRLIAFGLEAPCEFFDVVVQTTRYYSLIDLLFQRWSNPVRGMLMDFLLYMVSHVPKQLVFDFEKVYHAMIHQIPYVGNCRSYIAMGTEDGGVLVISKDSGKLLWKQRCFANPIDFVSIAPNGLKFVVLSLKDKAVMWIAKGRTRDVFELSGTSLSPLAIVPVIGVWKGDTKVTMQTQAGQVLEEISAPKTWKLF
jgi:hypothetical protein